MDTFKDWGYPDDSKQFIVFGAKYKKTYIEVRLGGLGSLSPIKGGWGVITNGGEGKAALLSGQQPAPEPPLTRWPLRHRNLTRRRGRCLYPPSGRPCPHL
jgi:hypothetical protein